MATNRADTLDPALLARAGLVTLAGHLSPGLVLRPAHDNVGNVEICTHWGLFLLGAETGRWNLPCEPTVGHGERRQTQSLRIETRAENINTHKDEDVVYMILFWKSKRDVDKMYEKGIS